MSNRKYWNGKTINSLLDNEIFVFGSNPTGIHGAGAAKAALKFGAKMGFSRGLSGKTYGLVTKNLTGKAGFIEKSTGIVYDKEGECSVSPQMISSNIDELYEFAKKNPQMNFLITYQNELDSFGNPKKTLNGYTTNEMMSLFIIDKDIPQNIIFHNSYQHFLELHFKNKDSSQQLQKPTLFTDEQNISPNQTHLSTCASDYNFFFNLTSPFSNFHPSIITYKHYTFISNEQFMMFGKAKKFNDECAAEKILQINNHPLAQNFIKAVISRENIIKNSVLAKEWSLLMQNIKKIGRSVKNFDEKTWQTTAPKIVKFGANLKFTQNLDLTEILLNSKHNFFCEASPYDKIWGCGLDEIQAKKTPPKDWPGLNLLGNIFTELKKEISLATTTSPAVSDKIHKPSPP